MARFRLGTIRSIAAMALGTLLLVTLLELSGVSATPAYGTEGFPAHPPMVVLVHERATALRRLMHSLIDVAGADPSLVWVFQDGSDRGVDVVVSEYHPMRLVRLPPPKQENKTNVLSSRLTFNYRFMIDYVFSEHLVLPLGAAGMKPEHIIVLEDDLVVAPDIVSYFSKTAELLDTDPSVFCISSYNDNSFHSTAYNHSRLLRGEHFMALGWMTSRSIYDRELRHRWMMDQIWDTPWAMSISQPPPGLLPGNAKARECVFPECPRTKHLGDPHARGGALTTSRIMQRLHFDHIRLAQGTPPVDVMEARRDNYIKEIDQLLARSLPIRCPVEALLPQAEDPEPRKGRRRPSTSDSALGWESRANAGRLTPVAVVLDTSGQGDTSGDDGGPSGTGDTAKVWDYAMQQLGFFGRGPGLDRLPRGIHRGVVRSSLAGRDLVLIGANSPYMKRHAHLRGVKPIGKKGIEECATRVVGHHTWNGGNNAATSDADAMSAKDPGGGPATLFGFQSRDSCLSLCGSIGRACDVDAMARANSCVWLAGHAPADDTVARIDPEFPEVAAHFEAIGGQQGEGCDACAGEGGDPDRELGGAVHAPAIRKDSGECMVASWAAISCEGEDPPYVTDKFCACV